MQLSRRLKAGNYYNQANRSGLTVKDTGTLTHSISMKTFTISAVQYDAIQAQLPMPVSADKGKAHADMTVPSEQN